MDERLRESEDKHAFANDQIRISANFPASIIEQLSHLYKECEEDEEPVDNTQD